MGVRTAHTALYLDVSIYWMFRCTLTFHTPRTGGQCDTELSLFNFTYFFSFFFAILFFLFRFLVNFIDIFLWIRKFLCRARTHTPRLQFSTSGIAATAFRFKFIKFTNFYLFWRFVLICMNAKFTISRPQRHATNHNSTIDIRILNDIETNRPGDCGCFVVRSQTTAVPLSSFVTRVCVCGASDQY